MKESIKRILCPLKYKLYSVIYRKDYKIVSDIGMADLPQIACVLHKTHKGNVKFVDIGGDCMIRYGSYNVANMSYLAVHLHFLDIKKGVVELEGNTSIPYVYKDRCEFKILVNGEEAPFKLFDAGLDREEKGELVELKNAFKLEYPLGKDGNPDDIKISFELITDGIKSTCGKINSLRFMPVADVLPEQYAVRNGYILKIEKNVLHIWKANEESVEKCEEAFVKAAREIVPTVAVKDFEPEKRDWILNIREEYFKRAAKKEKPIWLFFDRIDKADDNGEAMFKYVRSLNRQDADSYFVIDKDCPDYQRVQEIGPVIPALSDEHCLNILLADFIFSSQLNGFVENPFMGYEEYLRDLHHRVRVIFLQHGVTKDDHSRWLNRYNQDLFAIICSSKAEQESFIKGPYKYDSSRYWLTGMPRYDELVDKKSRYILFMPTWRMNLMEQQYDPEKGIWYWALKCDLGETEYAKRYASVLKNEELIKTAKECGYKFIFMPHPLMQPYRDRFGIEESDILEEYPYDTRWKDLFSISDLMITDYSSVAFDFSYLRKPLIYYQFDKEEFFGSHTYKEGYFDYWEDGFGEIVSEEQELVKLLSDYMKNECRLKDEYRKRIDAFFEYNDRNSCCRIMERFMAETAQE